MENAYNNYILIAEDDEDDQFLLVSAFKEVSEHFHLVFVENGIELLDHFRKFEEGIIKNLPSLLIVDLNMPKKNGLEAIKDLRTKAFFSSLKTVIFSTTGNEIEKSRCRQLDINDYFVKPSNYSGLLKQVAQFADLAQVPKEI